MPMALGRTYSLIYVKTKSISHTVMGLLDSLKSAAGGAPAPLPPAPHPIGVVPNFTHHDREIALRVRERKLSLSGDDFSVKDAHSGQAIFKVSGSAFSLRDSKTVSDAAGTPLFKIQKKLISIHSTYQGLQPGTDDVLFTVKSSFSLGTKLTATFKNTAGNGEEMHLVLRGDIFDRKAEVTTSGGVPVARISRSFANAGEILFDNQTYVVSVAPGVDAALLLAICICLDEKANDEKK